MNTNNIKAIITGGISGLGLACARKIIATGGKVSLFDINADAAAAILKELGSAAHFVATDVSDEKNVEQSCQQASDFLDGINVAINCAGVLSAGRVLGREVPMATDYFSKAIQINLIGSFNITKTVANMMQHNNADNDGQRGVIINTASIAAYEGQIGQAAYSASKAGIIGMTLPMAREFARIGVRVMTIAPGVFMTPMVSGMPENVKEALGGAVPFPSRLGNPAEFASTVAHIIDNTYLNGSVIRLDGAIRLQAK
ncbi:3-hydroxyacyl-CoA dehydrogenase [hydrothermal vent metagenome]|uniref:3-hydroxyacyl-CoA dehydrogenase n=1 Tax=hydrothermal vent metagenome TaxID=652676 RepID=A0A3B0UX28_9ZZZZ